jgi:hypothetical protein
MARLAIMPPPATDRSGAYCVLRNGPKILLTRNGASEGIVEANGRRLELAKKKKKESHYFLMSERTRPLESVVSVESHRPNNTRMRNERKREAGILPFTDNDVRAAAVSLIASYHQSFLSFSLEIQHNTTQYNRQYSILLCEVDCETTHP